MAVQSPLQILHDLQTLGLCSDLDTSDSNSPLFNRILAAFYMDIHKSTDARPLPAFIAGGRPVDLFRLFSVVQERGGFDTVSAGSEWGDVAEEIGFDLEFGSSVKLVFFKYLEVLEKSLRRVSDRCVKVEVTLVGGSENGYFSPSSLSVGLKKEHFLLPGRGFARRLKFHNGDCDGLVSVKVEGNWSSSERGGVISGKGEGNGSGNHGGVVSGKIEGNGSGCRGDRGGVILAKVEGNGSIFNGGVISGKVEGNGSGYHGDRGCVITGKVEGNGAGHHGGVISIQGEKNGSGDRCSVNFGKCEGNGSGDRGDRGGVILGKVEGNGSGDRGSVKVEGNGRVGCCKRKRDEMGVLLEWVRKVAKNPIDRSLADAVSSEKGKVKSSVNRDLFLQVVWARRWMFQNIGKGILELNIQRGSRLRSTEVNGAHNLQESNMQLAPRSYGKTLVFSNHDKNNNGLLAARRENSDARQRLRSSSLNFDQVADSLFGDQYRIRVPMGPQFQAEVPTWTGKPALPCTDLVELKWLGTRIWPPENHENKLLLKCNSTGRSRLDNCHCKQPGSVECFRFHIAERRLQLNRELGPAFYAWGFESMGEEVAASWTDEEERKFKAIVRLYRPSLNKNFWDQLPLCFPFKGRRKLASYYYNVFLLRRRSYQNHVTPYITDSDDDDESESGFMSSHII